MSRQKNILCIKFKITTVLLTQLHVRVRIWVVYQNTYMIAIFIKVPLPSQQGSDRSCLSFELLLLITPFGMFKYSKIPGGSMN